MYMVTVNYPPEALAIPYQLVFIWVMIVIVVVIAVTYARSWIGEGSYTNKPSNKPPSKPSGTAGSPSLSSMQLNTQSMKLYERIKLALRMLLGKPLTIPAETSIGK